ncbi:MAG: hypothetical protein CM15mP121_0230 [Bacteroidota bacterium]|nr:MAG: hypothetical protein CM15mP121_0230 [Bacteroidota bacterium]
MVKKEKLIDFCNELANKIILNSPNAIKYAIKSLNSNYKEGFDNFLMKSLIFQNVLTLMISKRELLHLLKKKAQI